MFALFEPTAEEAAATLAATPPNADQLLHPRIRPHCGTCGRWVREATVRRVTHRDSMGPADDDWTGTCALHGERVDVVWDEG